MVIRITNPIKYLKKNIDKLAAVDKAVKICINPSVVAATFEESPPAKLTMVSFIIEFTSDATSAAVNVVIVVVVKNNVMLDKCFIYLCVIEEIRYNNSNLKLAQNIVFQTVTLC